MTPEYHFAVINILAEVEVFVTEETQMISLNEMWKLGGINNNTSPLNSSCWVVGVGNRPLSSLLFLACPSKQWCKLSEVLSPQMGVASFGARTVWRPLPVAEMVRKWLRIPLFLNQLQKEVAPSEDLGTEELFSIANVKYEHCWGQDRGERPTSYLRGRIIEKPSFLICIVLYNLSFP